MWLVVEVDAFYETVGSEDHHYNITHGDYRYDDAGNAVMFGF
jgi:hypothetical protein